MDKVVEFDIKKDLTLVDFYNIVYKNYKVSVSVSSKEKLFETRAFIDDCLKKNLRIYGVTTGFADLRKFVLTSDKSQKLSENLLNSHDTGIGKTLRDDVVKGAMVIRANGLSKGLSGFSYESLEILNAMINENIIPVICETGSLGASGDLAPSARLGRAMMGADNVMVKYKGKTISAKEALAEAKIKPFVPKEKEGLSLINGTNFMTSILAIAYFEELELIENIFPGLALFLNSVRADYICFASCVSGSRNNKGINFISKNIMKIFSEDKSFCDANAHHNDYCIRCIPQILGAKIEEIFTLKQTIRIFLFNKFLVNEINAPSDNPLIFSSDDMTEDVLESSKIEFNNKKWVVLSGGNFHGETLSQRGDIIRLCNAKISLILERHMTYILNEDRNSSVLPYYLIHKCEPGLNSGFMILQYTGNSLAQKICFLSNSCTNFNLTSGNESEDIVSYGMTSCLLLLEQIEYFKQFLTIYVTMMLQSFGITREKMIEEKKILEENIKKNYSEIFFQCLQEELKKHKCKEEQLFPIKMDTDFNLYFNIIRELIDERIFKKYWDLSEIDPDVIKYN